jgi:hypothetical protein
MANVDIHDYATQRSQAAEGSAEAGALLTAKTWPFLIIPGFAVAEPVAYSVRLQRVRARRERLRRAVWMLD